MLTDVIMSLRVAGTARIFGHCVFWRVHRRDDTEASAADSPPVTNSCECSQQHKHLKNVYVHITMFCVHDDAEELMLNFIVHEGRRAL